MQLYYISEMRYCLEKIKERFQIYFAAAHFVNELVKSYQRFAVQAVRFVSKSFGKHIAEVRVMLKHTHRSRLYTVRGIIMRSYQSSALIGNDLYSAKLFSS